MGWREGRLGLRLVRGRGLYDGREAEYEECVGYAGYNNLAGIFISIFPRLLKSSQWLEPGIILVAPISLVKLHNAIIKLSII